MKNTQQQQNHLGAINHPLYKLNEAIYRLQEEHVYLQESLTEIYVAAKTMDWQAAPQERFHALKKLEQLVRAYMLELNAHSEWEEKEMFPMIAWYFGEELQQFTLMEQEHELAEQYMHAFLGRIDRVLLPVAKQDGKEMVSYLLQAYTILKRHFQEEEEVIKTLANVSEHYGY